MKTFSFKCSKVRKEKAEKVLKKAIPKVKGPKLKVIWDSDIGIYAIENESSKSVYVGQSKNVPVRIRNHRMNLRNNSYLRNSGGLTELQWHWNQSEQIKPQGLFTFEQIHECEEHELYYWETYFCKKYDEEGWKVFNMFQNTEISGLMCPEQFKPIINKMIDLLDKGKLSVSQLEAAITQIENQWS